MDAPSLRILFAGCVRSLSSNESVPLTVMNGGTASPQEYETLLRLLHASRTGTLGPEFRSPLRTYEPVFDRSWLVQVPRRKCAGVCLFHDGSTKSLSVFRERAFLYRHAHPWRQLHPRGMLVCLDGCAQREEYENDALEVETRSSLQEAGWRADEVPLLRMDLSAAARLDPFWQNAVAALAERLDDCIDPLPSSEETFVMTVAEVFSIRGRGTVLTGRIERGAVRVGDEVDLVGISAMRRVRVVGLELSRRLVEAAPLDSEVGVLVQSVPREEISTGMQLVSAGTFRSSMEFAVELHRAPRHWPGRNAVRSVLAFGRARIAVSLGGDDRSGYALAAESEVPLEPDDVLPVLAEESHSLLAVARPVL